MTTFGAVFLGTPPAAVADSAAGLSSCPFWTDITPPARTDTPWIKPLQTAPMYDISGRIPAPQFVSGQLTGGQVTVTFDRVPGATAYRFFRNAQALQWITDTGQATYTATDPAPCQNAFYTLTAMSDPAGSIVSKISPPLQLQANGTVQPWVVPVGQTQTFMITSYNDPGSTAVGYTTSLGMCAVDPRVIPWGIYFYVQDYGYCFSGDIGTWIQNQTVDVWLPGTQANGWGVQHRTLTFIAQPGSSPPPTGPPPTTPPPTASTAPLGVAAVAGTGQETVSWSPPANNGGSAVTYYAIYAYPQVATNPIQVTAGTSFTFTGLTSNTYYTFTVTAWNGVGWSAWAGWSSWVLCG